MKIVIEEPQESEEEQIPAVLSSEYPSVHQTGYSFFAVRSVISVVIRFPAPAAGYQYLHETGIYLHKKESGKNNCYTVTVPITVLMGISFFLGGVISYNTSHLLFNSKDKI